jgi:hypothetical protein
MGVDDQILERLISGQGVTDIARNVGMSRTQVYNVLDGYADAGVLSRLGDLPDGAVTEVCMPLEFAPLLENALRGSDLPESAADAVRALCQRYGLIRPKSDDRYTRETWKGHTARRVDFTIGAVRVMVVAHLEPRFDKASWARVTPQWRNVYIEYEEGDNASMPFERGRLVTSLDLVGKLWFSSNVAPKPLLLAVAWACESRALLRNPAVEQ